MTKTLINELFEQKIFPIIRNKDYKKTIEIAQSYIEGGVDIIEINIDSIDMYKAIEAVSRFATVCAGGIITTIQAQTAIDAGAKILSSPIMSINLVKFSKARKIPLIVGASTANEAYEAWKARVELIKLYPINAMGGAKYVENLLRPMPFLNIMPQGDVKSEEIISYLNAGAKVVGIGRDFYENNSLDDITKKIKDTLERVRNDR